MTDFLGRTQMLFCGLKLLALNVARQTSPKVKSAFTAQASSSIAE